MNIKTAGPRLAPLLVVRDAARAIPFYVEALGATLTVRYMNEARGTIAHADLAVGDAAFSVTEETRGRTTDAPPSLGGSPVVLQVRLPGVETVFARMCGAGSVVVDPLQEFRGERMGRVRDPFGHLWLLIETTVLDGGGAPQEPSRARDAARIHLVVGPVGAGKSTFALALGREHDALRLNLDEWMADLFRPDRPETGLVEWYVGRAERCVDQIWKVTARAIDAGTDVVLEIGLIRRRDRERFYRRVEAAGYALVVYALDAPRELRRQRVEGRNRERGETFSMVVPPQIFETASDMWEPLDEAECRGRDVRRLPDGSSPPVV